MTAKTCENSVAALEDMFKYLDDQDNKVEINYINRVTFDEGSEFKGEFQQRLEDEEITVRRLNPEKLDHK